jgi:hypothetical protein
MFRSRQTIVIQLPFYYQPHELATIAATELQAYLASQSEWFAPDSRKKLENDGVSVENLRVS